MGLTFGTVDDFTLRVEKLDSSNAPYSETIYKVTYEFTDTYDFAYFEKGSRNPFVVFVNNNLGFTPYSQGVLKDIYIKCVGSFYVVK